MHLWGKYANIYAKYELAAPSMMWPEMLYTDDNDDTKDYDAG